MLSVAVVMFREVLEAALIVSIVLAATRGVAGRGRWISAGIAAGVGGACLIAVFAGRIANLASGYGQEVLNASILLIAVCMLAWHHIWMDRHGREMSRELKALGAAVRMGEKSLSALAIVVGAAVMREGSEAVLFLYGIVAADQASSAGSLLLGGILGTLAGVAVGAGLYFGLVAIPLRHLFRVTGVLILLLAAGLASQAASFLVQADLLPAWGDSVWNTSWLLADDGIAGRLLHTLIGYTARPSGMQLAFYAATIAAILGIGALVKQGEELRRFPSGRVAEARRG